MNPRAVFLAITNFGEPVLLLGGAVLLLFSLWRRGERRALRALIEALAASVVLTVGAKLALAALGHPVLDVTSPSGHTGLAAAFYLCAAVSLSRGAGRRVRLAALAAAAALVLAIAVSRVFVGGHDWAETVAGFAIGAGAAAWFVRRGEGQAAVPRAPLIAAFAALAILTNGLHVDAEVGLRHLAQGGLHWPHPRIIRHGHQTWLVL